MDILFLYAIIYLIDILGGLMNKGKTKYVILGLLTEGALTGYEIKKIIDIRFSFFWSESYGQLYPEFKKLLEQELITVKSILEPTHRGTTTYSITEKGIKALRLWLSEPTEKENVRLEILLKMYFSNNVEPKIIKKQIEEFYLSHKNQLLIMNMFQVQLSKIEGLHSNHSDILRVIDCGQKVNKAYIDWCEETIAYLERKNINETKN